jgi:phage baseplate assembly protein W
MTENLIGKGWTFPPKVNARGGIALAQRDTELEQAILIILSTSPGQRVMRPRFGCKLHELIFMPNNMETALRAERFVTDALGMWEPRIEVIEVAVRPNPNLDHALLIEINYEIRATRDRRSLVYPFYLIPEE